MASTLIKGRNHISYTQVSMLAECSLRWYLRYVCKIRKQQTIQMATGDVIHQILAENFRQKVSTLKDLPIDEASDKYMVLFDNKVTEGIEPSSKPFSFYKEAGLVTLQNYMRNMAPSMMSRVVQLPGMSEPQPAVELELWRQLPNSEDWVMGYIDNWLEDGHVIDYKIAAKKWGKNDEAKKKQAVAYGFLLNEPNLPFKFQICVRDAVKPVIQEVHAEVNPFLIDAFVKTCWNALYEMNLLRSGDIEPRYKEGYCSPLLCQHYQECQLHKMGMFEREDYIQEDTEASGALEEEL